MASLAETVALTEEKPEINTSACVKQLADTMQKVMLNVEKQGHDDIPGTLRAYKILVEFLGDVEGLIDSLGKFKTKLSYETIPEMFDRAGVDSIKLGGRNYIVGVRFNASIPNDKKEAGFKWLEEHGLGALIQPNVNPKTLSSAIAGYFEEKAELPPPDAVSVHKQTYTSVRKA